MTAPLIPANEGEVETLREVLRSAIHARRMLGPWHDIDLANAVLPYIVGCTQCGFNTCFCDGSPNAALSTPAQSGEVMCVCSDATVDEARRMLADAFAAGALACHDAWIGGEGQREPDFAEAASDYSLSVDLTCADLRPFALDVRKAAQRLVDRFPADMPDHAPAADEVIALRAALSPDTSKVGAVDVREAVEGIIHRRFPNADAQTVVTVAREIDTALRASPPPVEAGMVERIEAEARRYAGMYPEASDGRNTFVIFANWVSTLSAAPRDMEEGR